MVKHYHGVVIGEDGDLAVTYLGLLDAAVNSQAKEGSIRADDQEAARILRDRARQDQHPLGNENLTTIMYALRWVMEFYHMSRHERRNAISNRVALVAGEGNGVDGEDREGDDS